MDEFTGQRTYTVFNNGCKYIIEAYSVEYNSIIIRFADNKNRMVAYFPIDSVVLVGVTDNPVK